MADSYVSTGTETVTSSLTAVVWLIGLATLRADIQEVKGSANSAVANMLDEHMRWVLNRFTVAPTGGAMVPEPVDSDAPDPGLITGGQTATAEGTVTGESEVIDDPVHVRSFLHWLSSASPFAIKLPAVAAAGMALRVQSFAYVNEALGRIVHFE